MRDHLRWHPLAVSFASLFALAGCPTGPSITSQPADSTVGVGSTATFQVTAKGDAPLSYQWQKDGTAIAGATESAYTTPATTAGDSGATFTVVVKNASGSVTSNAAKLTVTAITTNPQTLTVHTADLTGSGDPPFLAFQDGDGPWQSVTHAAGGTYTFTVTADRYGIAVADDTTVPGSAKGLLFQGTVSEMPVLDLSLGIPVPALYKAEATVVNIPDAGGGGPAPTDVVPCGPTNDTGFVTCNLPSGNFDALALSGPLRELRHDLSVFVTNGTNNLGTYDMFTPSAFTLADFTLTIQGLKPSSSVHVGVGVDLHYGLGHQQFAWNAANSYVADGSGVATAPLQLIPPSVDPAAVQWISFTTFVPATSAGDTQTELSFLSYFHLSEDQSVDAPTPFTLSAYALGSSAPYPRAQATWVPLGNYSLYTLSLTATNNLSWACFLTTGWLGSASTNNYVFPDLSAVTGWSSNLQSPGSSVMQALLSGSSARDLKMNLLESVRRIRGTGTEGFEPVDGDGYVFAQKQPGSITIP